MSSWDFIIENIKFSYSSTSTFETCAYSFKLTYLDLLPRENNFFGEFGTLIHECFEQYFTGKLEAYELSGFYSSRYNEVVKTPAPSTPLGMADKYKQQGLDFFNNFHFNKEDYEILLVEDTLEFELAPGIKMVARPDLVLRNKENKKTILFDYKTATPYWANKATGKEMFDKKKIEGYRQQMYTYTYALRKEKGMAIDEVTLWYPRLAKLVTTPWVVEEEERAMAYLNEVIARIKNEEIFAYNNSNSYFCNELCGVRKHCIYRAGG
jgi:hypothetical protein